jgi:hypothetical protein
MKVCMKHWAIMREEVEAHGLSALVSSNGEELLARTVEELKGGDLKRTFDPLMSMNYHFTNNALTCGGLYLMGQNDTGENDGEFCPVCEFEKHSKGFDARTQISRVADQMAEWARSENLIPKTQ